MNEPSLYSIAGILTAAVRVKNSSSGNPTWRLTISGRRYLTKLDNATAASLAPASHIGEAVLIRLEKGRIVEFQLLKG